MKKEMYWVNTMNRLRYLLKFFFSIARGSPSVMDFLGAWSHCLLTFKRFIEPAVGSALLAFGNWRKVEQTSGGKGGLRNQITPLTITDSHSWSFFDLVRISYLHRPSDFLLIALFGAMLCDLGKDLGKHLKQEAATLLTTQGHLQTPPHQEIELNSLSILVFPPIWQQSCIYTTQYSRDLALTFSQWPQWHHRCMMFPNLKLS